MQEKSDVQLLRDYAENGDEGAFRAIVTRHTDFVYSAALRQVNSPDLAADLAQSVFADLARKARPLAEKMPKDGSLTGWLHRGTRYAALLHLRKTRRRLTNERQAMEQLLANSESAPDWERIRPVLDEALDSLGEEDREALLLRYFKNQNFHAVGHALGVSDDTAQKRVSRAVERLREFFAKRGVTVSASGLVVAISANAIQAAPVGLAVTISTAAALSGTIGVTTATATAIKTIAMTTFQKTFVTATIAAAVGTGIYQAHEASTLRSQTRTLQQQQAPLSEQINQLIRDRDGATLQLAALRNENERLNRNSAELLRLRGEVGRLRQTERELVALEQENQRVSPPAEAPATSNSISMDTPQLSMRIYSTDPNRFLENLNHQVQAKEDETVADKLRRFFEQNGVKIERPAAVIFDERTGQVLVHDTTTSLDVLENLVTSLNTEK